MKTIAEQILSGLNKFYAAFQTKRVLKTMEEVEANTSEANLVAAPVVAELNNKLAGQPEWIKDGTGKITGYKTGGADTVFPFNSFKVQKGSFSIKVGSPVPLNTSSKIIAVLLTATAKVHNTPYWDGNQLCDNATSHGAIIASNRMSVTFVSNQSSTDIFNYAILRE